MNAKNQLKSYSVQVKLSGIFQGKNNNLHLCIVEIFIKQDGLKYSLTHMDRNKPVFHVKTRAAVMNQQ